MKMFFEEMELVVSPSLHSILTHHFESWMDDDYNRKINETLGHFFPHLELIDDEMVENEKDETPEYKELEYLMEFVGSVDLKVYLT